MKKPTATKDELIQMAKDNLSVRDISNKLEISYMQTRYLLKKHNVKTKGTNCKYDWSKDNILKSVKESECKSDILRNMNIPTFAGNFRTLEKLCKSFLIDLSFLFVIVLKVKSRGNKFPKMPNDEVFKENSLYTNISSLRVRAVKDGLLKYVCYKCGNKGEWCGEKLSLELDHINGNSTDHRIENLRLACPNCHSQTANYRGRGKVKLKNN